MNNEEVVQYLTENNGLEYNLRKSVEELNELATVLMQKVNKLGGTKEPQDQEIIDEIGDVYIRLNILNRIFGPAKILERFNYKLRKFDNYIKEGKYKHI